MANWKKVAGVAAFGVLMLAVGLVVGQAQQKKATLTTQDYIDIQQLVARYPYALDGGLENGKVYADLFTDDGEFHQQTGRVWKGRAEILTIAKKEAETPNALGHFIMNHMIEPTSEGAVGKQVLVHRFAARRREEWSADLHRDSLPLRRCLSEDGGRLEIQEPYRRRESGVDHSADQSIVAGIRAQRPPRGRAWLLSKERPHVAEEASLSD